MVVVADPKCAALQVVPNYGALTGKIGYCSYGSKIRGVVSQREAGL